MYSSGVYTPRVQRKMDACLVKNIKIRLVLCAEGIHHSYRFTSWIKELCIFTLTTEFTLHSVVLIIECPFV